MREARVESMCGHVHHYVTMIASDWFRMGGISVAPSS